VSYATAGPAYLGRGWFTIPACWPDLAGRCACGRGHEGRDVGKVPLLSHYREHFTRPPTATEVKTWGRCWPRANVALLLQPSELLVIDPDTDAALAEALTLGIPATPSVATGKASHYYCRRGAAPIARVTHWGASRTLDILAHGYVITPPSRHASGREYRWRARPDAMPLADPPRWAIAALERRGPVPDVQGAPASLPSDLPAVTLADLRVSPRIKGVIVQGYDPVRYASESEARFGVLQALITAGYSDAVIAGVIFDRAHAIGGKRGALGTRGSRASWDAPGRSARCW